VRENYYYYLAFLDLNNLFLKNKICIIIQGTIIDNDEKELLEHKINTHSKLDSDFKLIALREDEDISQYFVRRKIFFYYLIFNFS
jgi:hypothetical protein